MKIGIVTFHFAENCGAMLQCFALQEKLKMFGFETEVIDYRPRYHKKRYSIFGNPMAAAAAAYKAYGSRGSTYAGVSAVRAFLGTLKGHKNLITRIKTKSRFLKFMKSYINLSKRYGSLNMIKKNAPACDIYLSGSDQIWNPNITGGKADLVYFLDFGNKDVLRMTYAASACDMGEIAGDAAAAIIKMNAISLREEEMKDKIEQIYGREVHISLDPTFLLAAEDYSIIKSAPIINYPYILVYAVPNNGIRKFCEVVDSITVKAETRCIDISAERLLLKHCDLHFAAGPKEFLGYIGGAHLIITNSFHGTAFSLIYNKNFISVTNPERSSRITELLSKLELEHRIVTAPQKAYEILCEDIDYEMVNKRFDSMKLESEKYILDAIFKERENKIC